MAVLTPDQEQFIHTRVIRDMSEGVIIVDMSGRISIVNDAAAQILERDAEDLIGHAFAPCFLQYEENDAFTQVVLDAIYDAGTVHNAIAPYFTGKRLKQLFATASYLKEDGKRYAVILLISDISELAELRDALKAMQRIQELNRQLEMRNRLISETFGRYLSDEIVSQLLDTPDGLNLGGKKENLTVVMSDLRGFTALSESMPAEDLITMLNHYLAVMTDAINSCHGTIIEFLGDGIMTVFGAPIYSPEHASRAAAAALRMQESMAAVNAWNRERGYPDLEMGIGVNTGDVIVGNIGSEKRTKYGVAGSNVNLCGRIESYTVGGQVLVSESTLKSLDCDYTTDGSLQILPKGVDLPVMVYSLTGMAGEYNVTIHRDPVPAVPLRNPANLNYRRIDGKHISSAVYPCRITAVSHDCAIILTTEALDVYENIELYTDGKLTAKVTNASDGRFELRFTSRPSGFDTWYKQLIHA